MAELGLGLYFDGGEDQQGSQEWDVPAYAGRTPLVGPSIFMAGQGEISGELSFD